MPAVPRKSRFTPLHTHSLYCLKHPLLTRVILSEPAAEKLLVCLLCSSLVSGCSVKTELLNILWACPGCRSFTDSMPKLPHLSTQTWPTCRVNFPLHGFEHFQQNFPELNVTARLKAENYFLKTWGVDLKFFWTVFPEKYSENVKYDSSRGMMSCILWSISLILAQFLSPVCDDKCLSD